MSLVPTKARRLRRRDWIAIAAGVAVIAAAYLWTQGSIHGRLADASPLNYYAFLTDALLSRHLYLKIQPDPQLLALVNPYAGWQGAPALHDASLYHGHYYLYFGITPVLVLLGPWRLLTGTFLREGSAAVIFGLGGFLLGTAWWVRARQRFFPQLGSFWLCLGVLMLGLGNYAFILMQVGIFYQVPIACAYFCIMAALFMVFEAVEARPGAGQLALLAGTSLAWGLCIGARPDYIFTFPAFALPIWMLWRRTSRSEQGGPCARTILAASVLPMTIVGLGLAWYNWARFGNPVEFGVHYQLASADESHVALAALSNIPAGLHAYLLAGPAYLLHFPFVLCERTFGVLPWAPFALAVLGFPLTLRRTDPIRDWTWAAAGGAVCLVALLNFFALCVYFFLQDRYALDFLPAATLGALLVAGCVATSTRPWVRALSPLLALAAILTIGQSALLALGSNANQAEVKILARHLDTMAARIEGWCGVRYGPVDMTVRLAPINSKDQTLLALAGGRDLIYLRDQPDGQTRIGFFHEGIGGPLSAPMPIDRTASHRIRIDAGSLYPPADYPQFSGWPQNKIAALARTLAISLDGRPVLSWYVDFYPSDPSEVAVGRYPKDDGGEIPFRGRILRVKREGLPSPSTLEPKWLSGPVRLHLRLPPFHGAYAEPLVSTGREGAGDLVYVVYLTPETVRFGHDSWNYGAVETPAVHLDLAKDHVIDIDLGSLEKAGDKWVPFVVALDGRLLISQPRPSHPTDAIDVVFGFNAAHSSVASASFTGPEFEPERLRSLPVYPPGAR